VLVVSLSRTKRYCILILLFRFVDTRLHNLTLAIPLCYNRNGSAAGGRIGKPNLHDFRLIILPT